MEKKSLSAEDRLFAALAYPYWYVAFPVYLLAPRFQQNAFLRYHLFHALVLGLWVFWGGALLWAASAILGRLALFGLLLYPLLKLAEWLAFGVTLYGAFTAFAGKKVYLPFVTDLVRPYLKESESTPPSGDPPGLVT